MRREKPSAYSIDPAAILAPTCEARCTDLAQRRDDALRRIQHACPSAALVSRSQLLSFPREQQGDVLLHRFELGCVAALRRCHAGMNEPFGSTRFVALQRVYERHATIRPLYKLRSTPGVS